MEVTTADATRSPHEQVAEEARALLARRRMSARKAADALGWSKFYISRRLSGQTPFDVNDLTAFAELLEVPVAAFFEPMDESPRSLTYARSRSVAGGSTTASYSTPLCPEISEMSFSTFSGPFSELAA